MIRFFRRSAPDGLGAGLLWLALTVLWSPGGVRAQEQIGLDATAPLDHYPALAAPAEVPVWDLRVGVLAALGPEYDGADSHGVDAVPYARISWRERIIFRGHSLEANLVRDERLRLGPMLRSRAGRDQDEAPILDGLGDVDRAFEAGGFVSFTRGPLRLRANVVHDVAAAHAGLVADVSATMHLPLEQPWFSLRLAGSWVDSDYMSAYFGVSGAQAQRSVLPEFNAGAGVRDVSISIGSRLALSTHVSALFSLGYTRLLGDAARSPIVADHGSADQFVAAVGAIYRF